MVYNFVICVYFRFYFSSRCCPWVRVSTRSRPITAGSFTPTGLSYRRTRTTSNLRKSNTSKPFFVRPSSQIRQDSTISTLFIRFITTTKAFRANRWTTSNRSTTTTKIFRASRWTTSNLFPSSNRNIWLVITRSQFTDRGFQPGEVRFAQPKLCSDLILVVISIFSNCIQCSMNISEYLICECSFWTLICKFNF